MSGYECIVQNVKLSLMTLNFKQYKMLKDFSLLPSRDLKSFIGFSCHLKMDPPKKRQKVIPIFSKTAMLCVHLKPYKTKDSIKRRKRNM